MQPFEFKRADTSWPEGETLLHVYALCDLASHPALAALVRGARAALRDFPLSHVEDRWLHITIVINRSRRKDQVRHLTWSLAC